MAVVGPLSVCVCLGIKIVVAVDSADDFVMDSDVEMAVKKVCLLKKIFP